MKKITVITGPARCGKTRKAKELAKEFKADEVVFLPMRFWHRQREDPFFFSSCNPDTKLIIMDDIPNSFLLKWLLEDLFQDGIEVNTRTEPPYTIDLPKVIITCNENITPEEIELFGVSYINRIMINELGDRCRCCKISAATIGEFCQLCEDKLREIEPNAAHKLSAEAQKAENAIDFLSKRAVDVSKVSPDYIKQIGFKMIPLIDVAPIVEMIINGTFADFLSEWNEKQPAKILVKGENIPERVTAIYDEPS